jgi:hypothetical protein
LSDAPAPLTPADCDLQDFPFMPLMVSRLRKSKAWVKARRNPALGFYMINLWASAWHDVPAGSLEDDDDVLADAAMCEPSKWPKARDEALRGWVKCSDGRLYHPVVSERVLEAWTAKTERRDKNDHERDRKRQEREERAQHFATLKAVGIHKPWNTNLSDLREAVLNLSAGQVSDKAGTVPDLSRLREGQGEGQGQGDSSSVPIGTDGVPPAPPPASTPPAPKSAEEMAKAELWRAAVSVLEQGGCPVSQTRTFMGKLVKDYTFPVVQQAVAAAVTEQPADAREYLKATCQRMAGERQPINKQEALEQRGQRVVDDWAKQGAANAAA